MKEKKDLRIIKTQNTIYNALITLLKTKTFEEIKVSDICNEALINRSTFYDHYTDKYELLMDLIDKQKARFELALSENEHIINTKNYYIELIKIILNEIEEEKNLYFKVLINNQNSILMDIIMEVVTKDIEKRVKNNIQNSIPSEIITKFYVGAVVNVGIEWLKNSKKYSKDELLKYIEKLIPDNIENI